MDLFIIFRQLVQSAGGNVIVDIYIYTHIHFIVDNIHIYLYTFFILYVYSHNRMQMYWSQCMLICWQWDEWWQDQTNFVTKITPPPLYSEGMHRRIVAYNAMPLSFPFNASPSPRHPPSVPLAGVRRNRQMEDVEVEEREAQGSAVWIFMGRFICRCMPRSEVYRRWYAYVSGLIQEIPLSNSACQTGTPSPLPLLQMYCGWFVMFFADPRITSTLLRYSISRFPCSIVHATTSTHMHKSRWCVTHISCLSSFISS